MYHSFEALHGCKCTPRSKLGLRFREQRRTIGALQLCCTRALYQPTVRAHCCNAAHACMSFHSNPLISDYYKDALNCTREAMCAEQEGCAPRSCKASKRMLTWPRTRIVSRKGQDCLLSSCSRKRRRNVPSPDTTFQHFHGLPSARESLRGAIAFTSLKSFRSSCIPTPLQHLP
jgi:hypothetical protein